MNITELSRKLRVPVQELHDALPQLGVDIGKRAIKIDDRTAYKIIGLWPAYRKKQDEKKRAEKEKERELMKQMNTDKEVKIPAFITVRDFSHLLSLSVNQVMTELMKNGVLASLNERIDFDTAMIIATELGFRVAQDEQKEEDVSETEDTMQKILQEDTETQIARPPIIVVMGHVDHGKTKLLDAIRNTDVVSQEKGGITQHIGAYQVEKNGRKLTFIDTPGHEAFTAMRSRGARVADIAILVVAADDSIKPQTVEAIKIIEKAKIPMIVAINKIDKPDSNIEKVKQDLVQRNLAPEEWGGKTICVPISAKDGTNIEKLLDMVLLIADVEQEKITANPERAAVGTVIESHIDKGEGPVATLLVQTGTLRPGDYLTFDSMLYGKVRAMKDWRGADVASAGPSLPVKVIGFKVAPTVGDVISAATESHHLQKVTKRSAKSVGSVITSQARSEEEDVAMKMVPIMLKTDVLGSAEAIVDSLEKIESADVVAKIISRRLGNITPADVTQAAAEHAHILGFSVQILPEAASLAKEQNVSVKTFGIIYELIDYVKAELEKLLEISIVETKIGSAEVLKIFKTESKQMILGLRVKEGKIKNNIKVKVFRGGEFVVEGRIESLQSGKQEVSDVMAGQDCGVRFAGKSLVEAGDTFEFYQEDRVEKVIR